MFAHHIRKIHRNIMFNVKRIYIDKAEKQIEILLLLKKTVTPITIRQLKDLVFSFTQHVIEIMFPNYLHKVRKSHQAPL